MTGKKSRQTQDEAQAILEATRNNHHDFRGVKVHAAEDITKRFPKAIEDSQGIGAIPVGERLYQFKISLRVLRPLIWRRIQVRECTLDKLHEHIQTAVGWFNCHLHRFKINGEIYGDPELLDDGFEDSAPFVDSTNLKRAKIVPKNGQTITFEYEYDFGDCWLQRDSIVKKQPNECDVDCQIGGIRNTSMPNLFENIPSDLSNEVSEILAQSKSFRIERIVSFGQSTPDGFWDDQDQTEWVMVLQGEAKLLLEANHKSQLSRNTGGPKDLDLLMARLDLEEAFPNCEVILSQEIEREVNEGRFHTANTYRGRRMI